MPRVTIVIPLYNTEAYIAEALDSVLAQTFTDWECVVVNDGSTDRSAEIVARYVEQDPRICLVHQTNQGVSVARNTGVKHASPDSQYLFFLDADDMLEPEALERLVAYLDAHPEVGLVGCQFTRIDAEGKPMDIRNPFKVNLRERTRWVPGFLGIPRRLKPSENFTPFLTFFCGTGQGTFALYRRSVFEKTKGWDPDLKGYEDADMFCQMSLIADVHYISDKLYRYRDHLYNQSKSIHTVKAAHIFADKWRKYNPQNEREAKLLAEAVWYYEYRHEPFRFLWVGLRGLIEGVFDRKWRMIRWGMRNIVHGLKRVVRAFLSPQGRKPPRDYKHFLQSIESR